MKKHVIGIPAGSGRSRRTPCPAHSCRATATRLCRWRCKPTLYSLFRDQPIGTSAGPAVDDVAVRVRAVSRKTPSKTERWMTTRRLVISPPDPRGGETTRAVKPFRLQFTGGFGCRTSGARFRHGEKSLHRQGGDHNVRPLGLSPPRMRRRKLPANHPAFAPNSTVPAEGSIARGFHALDSAKGMELIRCSCDAAGERDVEAAKLDRSEPSVVIHPR